MSTHLADVSTRARRKIAVRLLPFLTLSYSICYVDRANVRENPDAHCDRRHLTCEVTPASSQTCPGWPRLSRLPPDYFSGAFDRTMPSTHAVPVPLITRFSVTLTGFCPF